MAKSRYQNKIRDYNTADSYIWEGKKANTGRMIPGGRNTLMQRNGEDIDIILHGNKIMTYHKDGRITISTCGWPTKTTKDRLNEFLPHNISVFQKDFEFWVAIDMGPGKHEDAMFVDGMVINTNGKVSYPDKEA